MKSLNHNIEERRPALLRLPAVCAEVGLSQSHIRALARAGKFPKPLKVGRRAVAWRSADLFAWIASQAADRDAASGTNHAPVRSRSSRRKKGKRRIRPKHMR